MRSSLGLKIAAGVVLLFLHLPLALIVLYAFSAEDKSYVFPPPALTTQWFGVAWQREDVWAAIRLSFEVAAWSTAIALVLGTLAAGALARAKFFGRDAVSMIGSEMKPGRPCVRAVIVTMVAVERRSHSQAPISPSFSSSWKPRHG